MRGSRLSRCRVRTKAQVSVYILLGLVLILTLIPLFFYIRSEQINIPIISPSEVQPVKSYVENCMQTCAHQGIILLSNNGGMIRNSDNMIHRQFADIQISVDNNVVIAPTFNEIEKELSFYIDLCMPMCVRNMRLHDYNVSTGNSTSKVKILEDNIYIEMDLPIILERPNSKVKIDRFSSEFPLPIFDILQVREKLIELLSKDESFDFTSISPDYMDITMVPFSSGLNVYSIVDTRNLIRFNVAERFNYIPNSPPVIQAIPDQYAIKGVPFEYRILFSDPDNDEVMLSSDTYLFDIQENGIIRFTPSGQDIGIHNITITAADSMHETTAVMIINIGMMKT